MKDYLLYKILIVMLVVNLISSMIFERNKNNIEMFLRIKNE